jgi:hypothetical protein
MATGSMRMELRRRGGAPWVRQAAATIYCRADIIGRDWGGAGFVESDIISFLKLVNKSGSLTICISYQTSCLLSANNHKLWAYIF